MLTYSHSYDCTLSLYDMYLQHGNVGIGYSYLMFLAYKSIAQKSSAFFQRIWKENEYSFETPKSEYKKGANFNCAATIENSTLISSGRKRNIDPPVGLDDFDGYDIFFNMVTDLSHVSILEVFERITMSLFLLNCLEATNYFKEELSHNNDVGSNDKDIELQRRIMFAGLIFHAYSVILSNNHTVGEVSSLNIDGELETATFVGIKRELIGNCVFARVASILNHSCDPNTSPVYVNGNVQVI